MKRDHYYHLRRYFLWYFEEKTPQEAAKTIDLIEQVGISSWNELFNAFTYPQDKRRDEKCLTITKKYITKFGRKTFY